MDDAATAKAVTMDESQNLEWKSSWRDEYLKWICGFANAQGGLLVIGKNDRGEVVGVKDPLRLLEEIPNKTQSLLGIVVDVNLKSEEGGEYLEIPEGWGELRPGAWLVRGTKGEFYPVRADIFAETFDWVVESENGEPFMYVPVSKDVDDA